jgi:hypothetical protein
VSARVGNTCMLEQEEPDTLLLKLTTSLQVCCCSFSGTSRAACLFVVVRVRVLQINLVEQGL